MKITIIGTGYVGLVNGACLSDYGHVVNCIDIDVNKISTLNNGIIPIYEPGLEDVVKRNVEARRLFFSPNYYSVKESDLVFIAVGTPTIEGGKGADLSYLENAVKEVAMNLEKDTIIVMKSTVPVGTCKRMKNFINEVLIERDKSHLIWFDVVSNPEFLKEGDAVNDFFNPDIIVVGADNDTSISKMKELYGNDIYVTKTESSEMIKYASNAMLATRISFVNELANLCEKVGANIDEVKTGMGMDTRIGPKFLNPGCGYGGSCFPKDVKALLSLAEENEIELNVVKATEKVNNNQKHIILEKLKKLNDYDVNNKTYSILGLAFKPETDDMREAPSLTIIEDIFENFENVKIKAYDPMIERINVPEGVIACSNLEECLKETDFIILVTEWDEFKKINWNEVSNIVNYKALVIDGRNIFNQEEIFNNGLTYLRIG